jgi:hypothetical protein
MSGTNEYEVIQDFYNKRANAHASLFVASMFGLFSLLALMGRIVDRYSFAGSNLTVLILLSISYGLVWLFGLYSSLNFFFHATIAQHAEKKIVQDKDRRIIDKAKAKWKWIPKTFADFKGPKTSNTSEEEESRWFNNNKENAFVFFYFLIGLLPLIAFFLWFC